MTINRNKANWGALWVLTFGGVIIAIGAAQMGSADEPDHYRYPTTFNNVTSRGNNPPYRPAPLLSDEAFYGEWDPAASKWVRSGLFDYASRPGLKPVEDAVKGGDYEAARSALLAYFRQRDDIEIPELPDADDPRTALKAELFMEQVYFRHGSEPFLQFEVGAREQAHTLDVTQHLRPRYMLMARRKGAGAATFSSREAASHKPLLRLTIGGKQLLLAPTADTTVQFGAKKRHGMDASLLVRGSKPGVVVDGDTCRAVLSFDLNNIDRSQVEKVELVLYGRTDAPTGTMAVLLVPTNAPLSVSNEARFEWNNLVGNQFSYEGLAGMEAWRNPRKGNPHKWFFVTGIVRFAPYSSIIAMVRKTGDERYARGAIQIYLDYVEFQMFNRLDSGTRVGNLIRPSMALYKSPSMTPRALQIMIEHAWRLGEWYDSQKNWPSDHNFGSSYIGGQAGIAYHFPELRDTPKWWRTVNQRALKYTSNGAFSPDHSFAEPNTGYGCMVLSGINRFRELAVKAGATLPEKLVKNYVGIAWYAMDVSDPGGVVYPYGDTGGPHRYSKAMIESIAVDHGDPKLLFVATDGREGTPPKHTSKWYPDSRLGIMRSAWADRNALGLFVNARHTGGNHKHQNCLSLCAYAYGRPLIDDTYFYPQFNRLRKSVLTRDHNTIEVDGRNQSAKNGGGGMLINPQFDLFDGWYDDGRKGVRHRRQILLIKPSQFWIVSDHLEAKPDASHSYNQTWQLRPGSGVTLQEGTSAAATAFPQDGNLRIVPLDSDALTAKFEDGWWSSDRNTTVSYRKSVKGSTTFDTVLYPVPEGGTVDVAVSRLPLDVPPTTATALKVTINDDAGKRSANYYLSYEDKPTERSTDAFTTDAQLAYFEQSEAGSPHVLLLKAGHVLKDPEQTWFKSAATIDDIAVTWDADTKTVSVSTVSNALPAGVTIGAPFPVSTVILNDKPVGFVQKADEVRIE